MDLIINLNKPKGITSHDAVSKVKKIFKAKKAGHTGTLDPIAKGLLLICINRATRLASYFFDVDKEYRAVMKLGETTDTQDAYGKVIKKNDKIEVDKSLLEDTFKLFTGKIFQKPPMFSALKYKGKPLYKLARKGIVIERQSREVNIHNIELLDIDLPYVSFRVICSKGTYVRTLCHDIGKKIGAGAHLYELERKGIGKFKIKDSLTFDELQSISEGKQIDKGIYTMDEALSWLPEFKVEESVLRAVIHGNPIRLNNSLKLSNDLKISQGIRIKSPDGDLIAIGSYSSSKKIIKMDVVFVT